MSREDRKGSGIQSLTRASAILNVIVRNRDGIGLAPLSKIVGLHSSTTFHLVKTLAQLGYVRQDPVTKQYRVGRMIFDLASTAFDEVEMASVAGPYLDELAMRTGETSHFAIRTGADIVVLAKSEGTGMFRMAERTGITRPAHASALGKVLLAAMTQDNLEVYLESQTFRPLTDRTITDPATLRAEIARVRKTGVAYDEGEFHPEIRCVAVPVHNFTGRAIAALSVTTPAWRLAVGDFEAQVPALQRVAKRLSTGFGHRTASDCPRATTDAPDAARAAPAPIAAGAE